MTHYHAVIWIDHKEARIFQFNPDEADKIVIHAGEPRGHLHHRAGSLTGKRTAEDHAFLQSCLDALKGEQEWLIVGPGSAKTELVHYIHNHAPTMMGRVIGVETLDHPTDGELLKYARRYARGADRLRPQIG